MSDIVRPRSIITDDYFKEYSPLPQNYDLREIRNYYNIGERLWIVPIIGVPLYEELLDEVEEDRVTPENATLLLAIYPLLSFGIVYEALPFIGYHLSAVGITKGKSENSDSVSINDVNFISSQLRSQCEVLKSSLKKFLDEHKEHYPLYYEDKSITCDCEASDYPWILDYFSNGFDKHAWQRSVAEHRMRKFKPNSYNQLYTTRRMRTTLR